MKKVIKFFGIFVAVVAVALLIMNQMASGEKEIVIVSKQVIEAPAQVVYNNVRNFKNYPSWSPFRLTDPEQKYRVSDIDGQVGSKFHWVGVKETSEGYQEIMDLEEDKAVKIQCTITVPYEAKPQFNYYFTQKGQYTYVNQEFKVKMAFPANVIAHFTNLRKDMKAVNEKGLDLLKDVCENKLAQL